VARAKGEELSGKPAFGATSGLSGHPDLLGRTQACALSLSGLAVELRQNDHLLFVHHLQIEQYRNDFKS
jgi:hypothetical protein